MRDAERLERKAVQPPRVGRRYERRIARLAWAPALGVVAAIIGACAVRDAELRPSAGGAAGTGGTGVGGEAGSGAAMAGHGGAGGGAPSCGNGEINPGEQCDDGNGADEDGCSADCTPEPGWQCDNAEPTECEELCGDGEVVGDEACDDDYETACGQCNADCTATGTGSSCGDGAICTDDEDCDDGDAEDGDGCSSTCAIEEGWSCDDAEPTSCTEDCGDGLLVGDEECDDDNVDAADGCSDTCEVEGGWDCDDAEPTGCTEICGDGQVVGAEHCDDDGTDPCGPCNATCTADGTGSVCGDGVTCPDAEICDDGFETACGDCNADCTAAGTGPGSCGDGAVCPDYEECDDDDTDAGDGCSALCEIETGWSCAGQPSTCQEGCGDGLVVGTEECDDDNLVPHDGCSSACQVENGWLCNNATPPSTCEEDCGDGLVVGDEHCDDGHETACGNCNADCTADGTGATCGDGFTCPDAEFCDDGFETACGACNADCTATGTGPGSCGDGVHCPDVEFCDDGHQTACGACNADCSGPGTGPGTCGDGVHCPDVEFCDDGFQTACGACNADCTASGSGSACGDLVLCTDTEICDAAPRACTTTCSSPGTESCLSCGGWGSCTPPPESCNNLDDDCVDGIDNGFDCPQGQIVPCVVGTCSGTRECSGGCTWVGGCAPPWSPPTAPLLKLPQNGFRTGSHLVAASLTPTFTWAPSTVDCGAVTYRLQVDDSCTTPGFASCSFPSPELDQTGITTTSFTVPAPLPTAGVSPFGRRYYWRVQACDDFGRCGAPSTPRYVDVGRAPSDYNGDGYSDLLVSAVDYGASNQGRAYLFLGGPGGPGSFDTTPDLTITGTNEFGHSTLSLGDVNADGYADIGLGASQANAYLYYGKPNITTPSTKSPADADLVFDDRGDPAGTYGPGYTGSSPGDVNADGFTDVLFGQPWYPSCCTTGQGQLFLYLGSSSMDETYDWQTVGASSNDFYGYTQRIGDVDADGFHDLDGAAYRYSSERGRAYLYRGGEVPSTTATWTFTGIDANDHRFTVREVRDLDADGFHDIAVSNLGKAQVAIYRGGPGFSDTTPFVTIQGPTGGDFGYAYGPGDVNGDGHDDLLIGAWKDDDGVTLDTGAVYLYYGPITASTTFDDRALVKYGTNANDWLLAAHGVGDLNADGHPEVVLSAGNGDASGKSDCGYIMLIFGGPSFAANWNVPIIIAGENANDRFANTAEAPPWGPG